MPNKVRYFAVGSILLFSIVFFAQTVEKDVKEDKKKIQWQTQRQERETLQSEEQKSIETGGEVEEYAYRLGLLKDQVVVYRQGDNSVYEYTNLLLEHLPDAEQKNILLGKGFETEAELYAFLETYSS